MTCIACNSTVRPSKTWRSKLPNKTAIYYGIIEQHKERVCTMYGWYDGGDSCPGSGFAATVDEKETLKP